MTTEEKRARARQLRRRKRPMSVREIAEELDVSPGTAHRWINPKAAERYRLATRERKRRERAEEE